MKPREQIEWDRLTDMIGWLREMRVRLEKVQYARNARKKEQGE